MLKKKRKIDCLLLLLDCTRPKQYSPTVTFCISLQFITGHQFNGVWPDIDCLLRFALDKNLFSFPLFVHLINRFIIVNIIITFDHYTLISTLIDHLHMLWPLVIINQ